MHSKWRAGVFEDANIARIGRTRGRVYISNAEWTTGIIDIIGRRKYTSDVFPSIKLVYFLDFGNMNNSTATSFKSNCVSERSFLQCFYVFTTSDTSQWFVDGLPQVGQISVCTNLPNSWHKNMQDSVLLPIKATHFPTFSIH